MTNRWVLGISAAAALLAGTAGAEPLLDGRLAGLEFKQGSAAAEAVLAEHCAGVRRVEIAEPNFPLAARSESHLICEGFTGDELPLDRLAATFADDRLVLVYAEGGAGELKSLADRPLEDWMQFGVLWPQRLVIEREAGRAWIMSREAAHPNLFQWPNPYVDRSERVTYAASAARPGSLRFGRTLEELKPLFESQCAFTQLATYDVWLLNQPEVQQQLDCFGLEYSGFPRKVEAVFGDGILHQAWILTGAGEEARVRRALTAAFGPATYVDENWEIFDEGRVMLRKDKPEVLMLSDELAPLYRAKYIDAAD